MATPIIFKKRVSILTFLVVLVFIYLTIRLAYLQLVIGPELHAKAMNQWAQEVPTEPKRGTIFDRRGKELAISANADTVVALPGRIINPKQTAKKLAKVLNVAEDRIYELITRKKYLVYVARKVSASEATAVRALNLPGITFQIETRRYYPYQNLASHVLGFVGIDGQGLSGIEQASNAILRGIAANDNVSKQTLASSDTIRGTVADGHHIYLTVDEVIQHIVERELDLVMAKHNAKSALAVAMDPRTGEVLALAARPDFDPNKYASYPAEIWRNAVISDSYEPGSTFKIITAAAALNENIVNDADRFVDPGFILVAGIQLRCWKAGGHGSQTFEQAFWNSCNPAFVQLGQKLGAEAFARYVQGFGFGKKTSISLPGETSGIMFSKMGPVELGTASFGQGPAVTALQQVAAVSAVVNGGTLYVPQIVKEIRDANGALVGEVNPVVAGSPISKETSDRLRILLEGAITSGSGKSAYIEGYRVGGKTGTAQIPNPEGGYYPDRYIASFIGAVPIDDPKIVLLVMVNDPKGKYGYYGSMVAAPAFKAMVTDILPYIGIQPKFNSSGLKQPTVALVPELRGLSSTAALSHLRDAGLILKIEGIGITVLQQSPAAGSSALLGATVVVTLGENSDPTDKVSVGNVIGLSMKDASIRLSSLGLKIIIEGSGFAISQSPIGGSIVERGTAIRVNFKP